MCDLKSLYICDFSSHQRKHCYYLTHTHSRSLELYFTFVMCVCFKQLERGIRKRIGKSRVYCITTLLRNIFLNNLLQLKVKPK